MKEEKISWNYHFILFLIFANYWLTFTFFEKVFEVSPIVRIFIYLLGILVVIDGACLVWNSDLNERRKNQLNKTDFREIEQEIRKRLIEEIEEKNKLLVEGLLDDFKKGYIKPTELFNAYATHVEIMLEKLKREVIR
jgi:hypothetical protein